MDLNLMRNNSYIFNFDGGKRLKKTFVRTTIFLLLLLVVLHYANSIFAFKYGDGIYAFTKFYDLEDNTVDILILGSSHAFEDVNTGILWEEHGIASFVLAGSMQPTWNTYFYLKEALKTQTPKLIVLEAFMTTYDSEYSDDSRIIKNTYGLKWSKDKIEAIKVSSPKERWNEFLFGYAQYHTRYSSLSRGDFLKYQGSPRFENWKGFGCNMETAEFDTPNVNMVTARKNMSEKTEMYYRRIIKLALENDIPLLIVISPYAGITEAEQSIYNTVSDISVEYGIDFINYNLLIDEIGIDFTHDAADIGHLNYRGNQKFTHALGEYIVSNYNIPDRRNNEKYKTWELDSQYISAQIENQYLLEAADISTIIECINNQEYLLFVSADGECDTSDTDVAGVFDALGIPRDKGSEIWYINNKNGILYTSGAESSKETFRLNYHDVCLSRAYDEASQKYANSVVIDKVHYQKVVNGVNITIYNPVTQSVVDSFGFDMDDNYKLVR